MQEAIAWQGNSGVAQAAATDHTIDDAKRYVKENYRYHKTYTIRRLEPGFRALDVKSGGIDPKQMRAAVSQEAALNQFIKLFDLEQNRYMSGSQQLTASIGFSWHVGEDSQHQHAVFYYEDRAMGSDSITVAAKTQDDLRKMVNALIQSGLIPDPSLIKAKKAATAQKRAADIKNKGIHIGSRINYTILDDMLWSGVVTNITASNLEITIDQVHPDRDRQLRPPKIGEKLKIKPGRITKKMVSN